MDILTKGTPPPLSRCRRCGMHMHAENMIQHQYTGMCNWAMDMRLWRRNVYISQRVGEMKCSFYYREVNPLVEGVT